MKKIFTLSALVMLLASLSGSASAQMFKEDFNYTAGDSLTLKGYLISSGGTTNAILTTTPGLTFTGYPGSGVGNAARLTVTGQDAFKSFTPDSTGSVYMAFMAKVDSAKTGDYFIAMSLFDSQTSYYARTFIKDTVGGFKMGISKNNETPQAYGKTVFTYGTTYLVVVKYTFVAGSNNDLVTLYVFPSGTPFTTEPATPEVGPYNGSAVGDARNIGIVTLRQGSASAAPALTIDGIRIDSTWGGVTVPPVVLPFPENFEYAAGDSLTLHNWLISSGGTTNAVLTTAPGLTFTGYPGSGVGNAARLTVTGQDVYKGFTPDSTGSYYMTFMAKVDSAKTGDYFIAMSLFDSQTSYYARTFIKDTVGGFKMGISKNNETPQAYGKSVFTYGTTYLVVVKYTFVAGSNNDLVTLYVLPSGTALTAEPAIPEVGPYNGSAVGDARNLGIITLRQGSASAASALTIDGIRVEKSWYKAMGVPTLENFYSVGTGSVAGEKAHFASMKAALDSLSNGMPIPSNTTFYITSDITEPETGGKGLGLAVDPSPYTVTFKPAAGVKPTITLQYPSDGNTGPSGAFIIGMNSAAMAWTDLKTTRNIIIDGSNSEGGKTRDLTIQTTGVTRNAITMAIIGDVQNVTVKNTNVLYKVAPTAASTSGNLLVYPLQIRSASSTSTTTVEKIPSNITIDNNWISSNFPGVTASIGGIGGYLSGSISTYPSKIVISNNKIEAIRHAVALYTLGSTDVTNNEIIVNENVSSVAAEAILASGTPATATYNIAGNKITKLAVRDSSVAGGGVVGISIEGKGTYNIYNNMINGFALAGTGTDKNAYLYGIRVADSAVANIYYNTIRMDSIAPIGAGTVNYRGLYFTNGINTVKNNIVANYEDDFASVNIYRGNNGTIGTLLGTLTADYNDYHRASTTNAVTGYKDTSKYANMTLWRSGSGVDANSLIGAPGFVSPTDLHIDTKSALTPLISNAGAPIAGITKDIDGETRNATTPDIGADEFTMSPPVVPIPTVTIAEARIDANNDNIADHHVTKDTLRISGVITSPNYGSSGTPSLFIQDATGAMDLFGSVLSSVTLTIGDSVRVVGTITQFNGLVEIIPGGSDTAHIVVLKKNAVLPAVKRLTLREFAQNAEKYEGQLIELDSLIKATGTWPTAAANVSIYLTNAAKLDTAQMFLDADRGNFGPTEPSYPIKVVGFVSQFTTNPAANVGYEIMPRSLADIKPAGTTGVESLTGLPMTYQLMNNFPNPFNPSTVIRFALPQQSMAKLIVYDLLGREVRTLVNGMTNAGYFETTWNGRNNAGVQVSSGIYIYRMEAGTFVASKKMMLLK